MASINDFISSLAPKKTSYASLFSTPSTSYKSLSGLFASPSTSAPAASPTPAKPTPLVSSNPSSTGTTPTTVKPPVASAPVASTPKSQYVSSLTTPASTPVTSTPQTPVAPTTAPKPASTQNSDALAAYLALYTGTDLTKARTDLADVQNKNEQAQVDARRQYQAALDASGGTKAGAFDTAALTERRNNANLADLALQENAKTRTLSALTDSLKPLQIGDSYIDPTSGKIIYTKPQDSYTLGEGQVRYDAQGNKIAEGPSSGITLGKDQSRYQLNPTTGKYELVASGPSASTGGGLGSGTYVAGENPTVDAWANRIQAGTAKITDIPAAQAGLRSAVTVALDAMGNSPDGKPTTTELGKEALNTAKNLLAKFDKGEGTSAVGKSGFLGSLGYGLIPGTARSNFVTDFNSLKSQLSLDAVKYLKGQGQVSDAERALLASAVTKLNLSQSEDEFKKTLTGIIDKLSTGVNTDKPTPVILTKNGQSFDASDLSPAELQQALADGYVQQ